jgi:hypothetical protein
MDEAVERSALALDHRAERVPVELHVGEVLEQDVVRLVAFTLELLAGEGRPMGPGELVDRIADHDPDVLEPHLVDALVDRRDQLDQLNGHVRLHVHGLPQQDLRDRPPVPDVLQVRRGVALEQAADVEVLVVLGDAVCQVAQRIRRDVDSARAQPVLLAGEERPVVTEDVRDWVGHLHDAPRRCALSRQSRRLRGRPVDRSGSSRLTAPIATRPASGRASGRVPGRAEARHPPRRGRAAG